MVVSRWGQPRATTDSDLSASAPYGEEDRVVDVLLRRFRPRRADARRFAIDHRVLLLVSSAGVAIDVALAAFPFEIEAIGRATPWRLDQGVELNTCSAEHLLVYKLVAARPLDLVDVEGIVRRQGSRLDVGLVRRWGREFAELKEDPDLLRPFEEILRQFGIG
ncbi:MAG TPA: hypothetical protein VKD69_03440 [Vicinamibacterales bacterium]|nr:hypothetical protein [Vicinamibacterales bacterium]